MKKCKCMGDFEGFPPTKIMNYALFGLVIALFKTLLCITGGVLHLGPRFFSANGSGATGPELPTGTNWVVVSFFLTFNPKIGEDEPILIFFFQMG